MLCDGSGAIGFRRPDAALVYALPELDQTTALPQPPPWDAARFSGGDDGTRAGPQCIAVHHTRHARHGVSDVVFLAGISSQEDLARLTHAGFSHDLIQILDDHLVKALHTGLPRLAKADSMSGQGLEFQGHMLEDVSRPGAGVEALEKAPALANAATVLDHAGEPRLELIGKTGHDVR